MTQALAYEIGAVFLVTAMILSGSMARGLFSKEILKAMRLVAIAFGLLAVSSEAYRRLPGAVGEVFSGAATRVAPPNAAHKVPVHPQPAPRPQPAPLPQLAARAKPTPKVIEVDSFLKPQVKESPVEIEDLPDAVADAIPPAPIAVMDTPKPHASENPGKRAVKSVGRFLHLSHRKYEPPQAALPSKAVVASRPD
jgi:hypothetical protein